LRGSLRELADSAGFDLSLFLAMLRKLGLERSQFDYDIGEFSSGQKKKVLLAQSLCRPAHLYLWDEPLNFIDVLSRMQIEDVILEHQPTMIVIEHDSVFLKRIATRELRL
jgi:lincosamide and streptogramin A transport system ATP-binding/permease protein